MSQSRRILITGLSSHWGGRLAQVLESDPEIETIIGVDVEDPRHELERTEFVHVGIEDALLRRIIRAAGVDTVVDTRLQADAVLPGTGPAREAGAAGTRTVLAACAGRDSPVRKVVLKSSSQFYGTGRDDPAFFTEEMAAARRGRTWLEREVVEAEAAVAEFARDHPGAIVTALRCAPAIGPQVRSAHVALLGLPMVPTILGFDPRWQFVHEDDLVGALAHAVAHGLPGPYNVAGDGVLALSEVISLLGKAPLPVLPPWGTVFAAVQLRRLGLRVPVEMLRDLRHGRGLDNRRLKAAGYRYRYTTREAVLKLRAHQRLRPLLGRGGDGYVYEREVEEFLRWSPSVQAAERAGPATPEAGRAPGGPASGLGPPAGADGLDDLSEHELLEIISSLETGAMRRLREYEAATRARAGVLAALDHQLALRTSYEP